MNQRNLNAIAETILHQSPADWTGLILYDHEQGLSRFTNNAIHQNVISRQRLVNINVIVDRKLASIVTNQTDETSLVQAINSAIELVRYQPSTIDDLPPLGPQHYEPTDDWDESIAQTSPALRGSMVKDIIARASRFSATAAGSMEHLRSELLVADSSGVYAPYRSTHFRLNLTITKDRFSGWAERAASNGAGFDVEAVIEKALRNALMPRSDFKPEPGRYEVILEPQAVANLIELLSWSTFDAKAYYEGLSSLSNKLGKKITSPHFTLHDDAFVPNYATTPFDMEGHPRRKVTLIKNGVVANILHDRSTAKKHRAESTGHCQNFYSSFGPRPSILVVEPGSTSFQEMIAASENTVIITRFHYNRPVDFKHAELTGVTRDGVFLVRNGEIVAVPYNFRYNERVWEAFDRIIDIGNEAYLCGEHGQVVAPALRIKDFTFTETI